MKENKQTYTYLKDHGNDVSYENEVTYTVDPKLDLSEFRGPNDLEKQIEVPLRGLFSVLVER